MLSNMKPLDKKKHAQLKFTPVTDFAFARQLTMVPLVWKEMPHACKQYPIVFPPLKKDELDAGEGPLPIALLSLLKENNAFVDNKGKWNAGYIPAYIRQYPFALGKLAADDKFAVVIDPDAPQFAAEGDALFSASGEPSAKVQRTTEFLTQLQTDAIHTKRLTQLLETHQLLKPQQISFGEKEKRQGLRGFRVLDQKKLHDLDDSLLAGWVRNGLLALLMAHLFSLGNISKLATRHGAEALTPTKTTAAG